MVSTAQCYRPDQNLSENGRLTYEPLLSAFGTGIIEDVDWDKKRVTIKMDKGGKQFLNPQEVERVTSVGPMKVVSTTVSTTETTASGATVVKSVTTMGPGGAKTVTTTTTTTTTTN